MIDVEKTIIHRKNYNLYYAPIFMNLSKVINILPKSAAPPRLPHLKGLARAKRECSGSGSEAWQL